MFGYLWSPAINTVFKSHIRNIFFRDDIYYIFPKNVDLPSCINYLNDENIIIYNDDSELFNILTKFNTIILSEFFKLEWYIKNNNYIKKLKLLNLIYIAHGLHTVYDDYESKTKTPIIMKFIDELNDNKKLTILTACNIMYNIINNNISNETRKRCIKINSIPQFQFNEINYNLILDKNSKIKNSIVIFLTEYEINELNIVHEIINFLKNYYENVKFILKLKSKVDVSNKYVQYKKLLEDFQLKQKNVFIDYNTDFGTLMHSQLNIILFGGTTFFESLYFNDKTFLFRPWSNFACPSKFPLKFNKLLISDNFEKFKLQYKNSLNSKYFDKEYYNEKKMIYKYQMNVDKLNTNLDELNDIITNKFLTNIEEEFEKKWNNEF